MRIPFQDDQSTLINVYVYFSKDAAVLYLSTTLNKSLVIRQS